MRSTGLVMVCTTLVLALAAPTTAQIGVRLYGKVMDGAGEPIEGAAVGITVWEEGSKQTVHVETDRKGRYRAVMMHNSKAYRFVITKDGFETFDHIERPGLKRTSMNSAINKDFYLTAGSDSAGGGDTELGGDPMAPAAYNLGVKALQDRDVENARLAFEEAVSAAPDFALGRAALASTLYELGEYEEAVDQAKKAIELEADVRSLEILFRAGRESDDQDAIGKALAGLTEKRPDKKTARMLYNDGVTAFQAEAYDRAEMRFRKAREIDPDLLDTGRALARTYLLQGRFEEAKAEAERLVEIDRYDLKALDVLQRAREALEDGD